MTRFNQLKREILPGLGSTKITERKKAREALVDQLPVNVVRQFHEAEGKGGWLLLFEALYASVQKEIEAHAKPSGGDTAKKRVVDAAKTVRTMVERTHQCWKNKRVLSSVLEHLMSNLWKNRELYEPVASNYIKTLVTLISHAPNRTHLDLEDWKKLVELCFRIILEEDAPRNLQKEVEDDAPRNLREEVETDGEERGDRKRSRVDSQTLPTIYLSPNAEQKDANELLAYLLGPDAPLMSFERVDEEEEDQISQYNGNMYGFLPTSILSRMRKCIQIFKPENTLYPDLLKTLCSIMPTIALNRREAAVEFAQRVWDPLLTVWEKQHARQPQIKESLIVLFHQLLPYFVAKQPDKAATSAFDPGPGLYRICSLLQSDSPSRGNDRLRIESLSLRLRDMAHTNNVEAFAYSTFCAKGGLQASQVLAWAAIELQALCTTQVRRPNDSSSKEF